MSPHRKALAFAAHLALAALAATSLPGRVTAAEETAEPETEREQDTRGRLSDNQTFSSRPVADSPDVKALLAAHAGSELIICVAGCKGAGKPMVLLRLPTPAVSASASAAAPPHALAAGNASLAALRASPGDETVICIAGCLGSSGTIVWRGRQLAWIERGARDQLWRAMASLADGLQARLAAPDGNRVWVAPAARDRLLGSSFSVRLGANTRPVVTAGID